MPTIFFVRGGTCIKQLRNRKANRLKEYDYSLQGAYFITICTKDRKQILSKINVGTGVLDCPEIRLLKYGEIADKCINQLNNFYDDISVDKYVIMPNHIHLIIRVIDYNGQSRTPVPTNVNIDNKNSVIAKFVSTFKRFCNKEYGQNIWQARYFDHIVRGEHDYREIFEYIENNPLKWEIDELMIER